MTLRVGCATPTDFWTASFDDKQAMMRRLADGGVDQVFIADHVSFRDGSGTDGVVEIAALSQTHPTMHVMISVYLLALRHPLPVARQLATLNTIAPGRILLGVGVGGEDRHEIEVCGVDPKTRGRRTDESLTLLRQLATGAPVTSIGEFFQVDEAQIRPAIDPPIPILIGGRSDAALARTARIGDGWIAAWCSVRRFTEALAMVDEMAATAGRIDVPWVHGYQPWVGVADTPARARELVAAEMEAFYKVPFEAFEKYTPYGTAQDVADAMRPYAEAGASIINMKVVAEDVAASVEAAGDIATALKS